MWREIIIGLLSFWFLRVTGALINPLIRPLVERYTSHLSVLAWAKFQKSGKIQDLNVAIKFCQISVSLCPPDRQLQSSHSRNLVIFLRTRFEQKGDIEDLERAINLDRRYLENDPPDPRARSRASNGLAASLWTRAKKMGKKADLEDAIKHGRASVELCRPDHKELPDSCLNLSVAIATRFEQVGRMEDLEEALELNHTALQSYPFDHPNRAMCMSNNAALFMTRFERTGRNGKEDLDKAIDFHYKCLEIRHPGHPDRPSSLINLANCLQKRYGIAGNLSDIDEAIRLNRQSLTLCPEGHHLRSASLLHLANFLNVRFGEKGMKEDLEEAIKLHHESLTLRPPGHSDRPSSLLDVANGLMKKFDNGGRIEDLNEAIEFNRASLALCPPGHHYSPSSFLNLAMCLHKRFIQIGKMTDLDEPIELNRTFLSLYPPDHPEYSLCLANQASFLLTRFEVSNRAEDLEELVELSRRSVKLRPPGHPLRPSSLLTLASGLEKRYHRDQAGNVEHLDEAIALAHEALELCSPGHQHRASSLLHLAFFQRVRSKQPGSIQDLDEAIRHHRAAVALHPPGHPFCSTSLTSLAGAIFDQKKGAEGVAEALSCLLAAEACLPPLHPFYTQLRHWIALAHLQQDDLEESKSSSSQVGLAFSIFESSVSHQTSSLGTRLDAAYAWAREARRRSHGTTLRAYSACLALMNRVSTQMPTLETQQEAMLSAHHIPKSFASEAASSAIEHGDLKTAVKMLEQGRAMLWTKMKGYRSPPDKLRETHPDLAERFASLSSQLEHVAVAHTPESPQPFTEPILPFELQQRTYRALLEEWEDVVKNIRKVIGFQDFLEMVPYSTLQQAAAEGPVIIVNISEYRSDAIINFHRAEPSLVRLPQASPRDIGNLATYFSNPEASHSSNFSRDMTSILKELWDCIVGPVVNQLRESGIPERSRIWWCPTSYLCALPIHAAGPFLRGQKGVNDLYISSYTSTLSALIAARSNLTQKTTAPKMLVVGQSDSGSVQIDAVNDEVERIKDLSPFVTVLMNEDAKSDNVITALPNYSWAHFACHGHRAQQPFHSFFELHREERLELLELIKARLSDAELAFVAACHGAGVDVEGIPDEIIHLSAALQFCGFRGVVGTLWAMDDEDGPFVAEKFYGYMFRDEAKVDFRDAATAINLVTKEMRRKKLPLNRWVNFVHIGA